MRKKVKSKKIKNIINFLAITVLNDKIEIFLIRILVIVILITHGLQILYFMGIIFLKQL